MRLTRCKRLLKNGLFKIVEGERRNIVNLSTLKKVWEAIAGARCNSKSEQCQGMNG